MLAPQRVALLLAAAVAGLVTAHAAPATAAPKAAAILAALPDDVSMIVAADVKGSRGAALMPIVSAEVMARSGPLEPLLGANAAAMVDTYVVAKVGAPTGTWRGVIFICDGSFPADLLSATAFTDLRTQDGYDIYTLSTSQGPFEATLKGSRLMLADAGLMQPLIDIARKKKGKGAPRSAAKSKAAAPLRAAIAAAGSSGTAWAASLGTGSTGSTLASAGVAAAWLAFSLDVGADLGVRATLELPDAAAASQAVTMAAAGTAALTSAGGAMGLGSTLGSLAFTSAGRLFSASLRVTAADLGMLLPVLRSVLP